MRSFPQGLAILSVTFLMVTYSPDVTACELPPFNLFTQADRADIIVMGKSYEGGITVRETFKGTHRDELSIPVWKNVAVSSCSPPNAVGQNHVLFLDEGLNFVGRGNGVLWIAGIATSPDALTAALQGHLAMAHSARLHLEHLLDVVTGDDRWLADQAAHYLVNRVDYFSHIERDQARAITATLADPEAASRPLALLAVRLGDRSSLRQHLNSYMSQHPRISRRQLGLTYLDATLCGLTPPADYPQIIADERTPANTRALALDRCERHVGQHLGSFAEYATSELSNEIWRSHAEACRDAQGLDTSLDRDVSDTEYMLD